MTAAGLSGGVLGAAQGSASDLRAMPRVILPRVEIRISVSGELPPAKGEAKSMLSHSHPQRRRVLSLLAAASSAMQERKPLVGDIVLDMTLIAPTGARLPDATNMLGGVADALQARATGADVDHLGPLGAVACFHDDAQIQEIHYRRIEGDEPGYLLVVRTLAE